jgi:hypothetical protein
MKKTAKAVETAICVVSFGSDAVCFSPIIGRLPGTELSVSVKYSQATVTKTMKMHEAHVLALLDMMRATRGMLFRGTSCTASVRESAESSKTICACVVVSISTKPKAALIQK